MKTTEIRQKFLDYFADKGHEIVASSPLIPGNDPTLLFTNAGMVQFKETFLGQEKRDYERAVTSQRCVRAGGKHNDLENVGYTARHHTFFEMLGNFSFGDYFKQDAIKYAWELLTEGFGLPAEKLWVTVFEEDDEAEQIWIEQIGVPKERVKRIGAKDNFWAMGDTGPCGPCSEIFYDHGPEVDGGPPGSPDEDGDRYIEIWNLVFMQYNRDEAGELHPLPKPSVDTGMGLERIAAVLQHVHSNYEIDLFQALIDDAARVLGVESSKENKSLRVIADHIRATAFLIVDGVTPSNEGRGYVLRRIIRRAIRHGYQQGMREPFMHQLVAKLVAEMGEAYPELVANQSTIERVLEKENIKFNETLSHGIKLLDEAAQGGAKQLSGEVVFKLYDTYGFPVDLTADFARENGLEIDMAGFEREMEAQRNRARDASKFEAGAQIALDVPRTEFTGYEHLQGEAKVLALVVEGAEVDAMVEGAGGIVVLDKTPFYAESGGQVGDRGELSAAGAKLAVSDTRYLANKVVGHVVTVQSGSLKVGDVLQTQVTSAHRRQSAANHSATHLLHAALKTVLGDHVQQKGSLVEPERLRFDFSHFEPMTQAELDRVEDMVNAQVRGNQAVDTALMDLDEARQKGAAALFGEKYDNTVRVVEMGDYSLELCGGTHVSRTGDIGLFRFLAETGIAAGVRRVEAVTGEAAEKIARAQTEVLREAAAKLKAPVDGMGEKIAALLASQKQLEAKVKDLQAKVALGGAGGGSSQAETVNGVPFMALRQDDTDIKAMRATLDQARQKVGAGVVVVAGANDGKATVIVSVDKSLTDRIQAGKLVAEAAQTIGGRGGGKPEMAQGGGPEVTELDAAMAQIRRLIEVA